MFRYDRINGCECLVYSTCFKIKISRAYTGNENKTVLKLIKNTYRFVRGIFIQDRRIGKFRNPIIIEHCVVKVLTFENKDNSKFF